MLRFSVVSVLLVLSVAVQPVPSNHGQAGEQSEERVVKNVKVVQQLGTGEVIINYDVLAPKAQSVTVRFEYRRNDLDPWKRVETVTGDGPVNPGTGITSTWRAAADGNINTETAQVHVIVMTRDREIMTAESPPFKLDTRPPLGCECGYPRWNAEDIPLDVELRATVPNDSSPPLAYRFRLGVDGQKEPLATTAWMKAHAWTPDVLEPATRYWYQVEARDAYGNRSGWSYPVKFTTTEVDSTIMLETSTPDRRPAGTPSASATAQPDAPATSSTADVWWSALLLGLAGLAFLGFAWRWWR